jgi:hypothetical protein
MSASSKSIAAARQRRAGEAPPVAHSAGPGQRPSSVPSANFQAQQGGAPQRRAPGSNTNASNASPLPQPGPPPGSKLSLSDALNVLFVRVNKLEYQLAQPGASNGAPTMANHHQLADNDLAAVLSRLEALEKAPSQAAALPFLGGRGVATARDVSALQEKLAALDKEYQETKTLLMQLQNYTLETNQKLVNLVLAPSSSSSPSPSQPSFESVSELASVSASASASPTFSHIPEEVQKELQTRSTASPAITLSLKEIVKKELSSSDA